MIRKAFKKFGELEQLSKYQVNLQHGFYGKNCNSFETCNTVVSLMRNYILEIHALQLSQKKKFIQELKQLDVRKLEESEYEHAFQLYCMATLDYHWSEYPDSTNLIPAQLAVPLHSLAKLLNRPPILGLASTQIHNWKKINKSLPVSISNLDMEYTFTSSSDEKYFYAIAALIDMQGAPIIPSILSIYSLLSSQDYTQLPQHLSTIQVSLKNMKLSLSYNYSHVSPAYFYNTIRPKLKSYSPSICFESLNFPSTSYFGPSAIQSPIIRLLDFALDLSHARPELDSILPYLKKPHRDFLSLIHAQSSGIRDYIQEASCALEWNAMIDELADFRRRHLLLSSSYISKFNNSELGTGSSSFQSLLSSIISSTLSYKLPI